MNFVCPYKEIECPYMDTLDMSKTKECGECEHSKREKPYPDPNNEKEMQEWNTFMMGL